jgi:hypothetical protein
LRAKVWGNRREPELALMQRFYADVASAGLPLATPEIHGIYQAGGKAVTIERKLPGQPLRPPVSGTQPLDPEAAGCFIDVLRVLASVPCTASMRRLPVLDEDQSLWAGAGTFHGALIGLLDRRVARFGEVIRGRLPDFDLRYERLREKLTGLGLVACTVIHGDLVPDNILVDSRARPVAVLDFGFLTTAGDPAFDAATAAAIFDMYGPHARQITRALTDQRPRMIRLTPAAQIAETGGATQVACLGVVEVGAPGPRQVRRRARMTMSWVWCDPAPVVTLRGRISSTSICHLPSRRAATSAGLT